MPDEDEITPYATLHISGVFAPNAEHSGVGVGLPGMYDNPLKTLPFHARTPLGERLERQLGKSQNSLYENIDHLGRPSANPLAYLFFQPRYENEADNGPCDVLMIKPGYDKLTPGTKRKRRENHAQFGRTPYGVIDKRGIPVYDSIIRELELTCRSRRIDFSDSESDNDRDIHTILEVPSCDERSTMDRTGNDDSFSELMSEVDDTDDAISLGDIDFGCIGIEWNIDAIRPQPLASMERTSPSSQAALHMEDQTGLFGFYNNNLTHDAEA